MTGLLWLGLLAIAAGCLLLDKKFGQATLAFGITGLGTAGVLALMLICWPVSWYVEKDFKVKYEATVETIEASREIEDINGIDDFDLDAMASYREKYTSRILERAAITHKIIDINQKLATKKYWNDGLWDWYIPDDVANLEPIR